LEDTLKIESIENEWQEIISFLATHNQEKGASFFITSFDLKIFDEQEKVLLSIQKSF
jgi:hypothetical protein